MPLSYYFLSPSPLGEGLGRGGNLKRGWGEVETLIGVGERSS